MKVGSLQEGFSRMSAAYLIFVLGVVSDVAVVPSCTAVIRQKYPEIFQNASGRRLHHPFCTRMERVKGEGLHERPAPLTLSIASLWDFQVFDPCDGQKMAASCSLL